LPADVWAKWLDEADREEAAADRQLHILRSQVRDRVLHKSGLGRGSRVVDLGCGAGFLTLEAARMVGEEGGVTAVDTSPGALETLVRRGEEMGLSNLRTLEADISSLPLTSGGADVVVARSVLSYVPDRPAVLRESLRILRQGGKLSLFEPVLAEEEVGVDWGDEIYLWTKLRNILVENHPAYGFSHSRIVDEVREAGYDNVDSFIWHADVTRPFAGEEEAMEELRSGLPGELSLAACWLEHGAVEEEVRMVARRLALESAKPSYRDTLPCVFVWGERP
jgi:ubiquinone/menaquinone biosynthesis C-methylase UbiE